MKKFLAICTLGYRKTFLLLFPGIVMKSLLHGMCSFQILTTVKVNRVTTMEHVKTSSTITNVTVLRASPEHSVTSVWSLHSLYPHLKLTLIVWSIYCFYFSFLNLQYIYKWNVIRLNTPPTQHTDKTVIFFMHWSRVLYIQQRNESFFADIDECQSQPCQNNGTCQDLSGGYLCNCTAGFNGNNCENGG